ncbi:hypothetical protein MBLNU13_g02238t1 [Cladosporium sp. NU13]
MAPDEVFKGIKTTICQLPILLGKPSVRELQSVQPYSTSSFDLDENELGAISTALDGQHLCTRNERTEVETCDYDTVEGNAVVDGKMPAGPTSMPDTGVVT